MQFSRRRACVDVDQRQRFLEHRRTSGHFTSGIECERGTVEDDLVLPAGHVRIKQRQAERARGLGHARLALGNFAEVKRRCVDDAQHLRAGGTCRTARLVEPGVFADKKAEAQTLHIEHDRALPRIAPRCEVTPLVEHLIVRQFALAVRRDHATLAQHRCGVVALRHAHRVRPNITSLTELMRMSHHHDQTLQTGERAGAVAQRIGTGPHERGAQQQIFGRVAANAELGGQHQPRALRVSAPRLGDDRRDVASQVTDRRVDLRQRDADRGCC